MDVNRIGEGREGKEGGGGGGGLKSSILQDYSLVSFQAEKVYNLFQRNTSSKGPTT